MIPSPIDTSDARKARRHHWQDTIAPPPECSPTFRLDAQIAQARAEMGEERWAELNAEWVAQGPVA